MDDHHHPRPGISQIAFVRGAIIAFAALAATAALVFVALLIFESDPEIRRGKFQSAKEQELTALLYRLKASWDPKQRQRLYELAQKESDRFRTPLQRLLRVPNFELIEPAIEFAGATLDVSHRPQLVYLAAFGTPSVRAKAVLAVQRLDPWQPSELATLAKSAVKEVQLAALEAAGRGGLPLDATLELMSDEDEDVRAAACSTLPEQVSDATAIELGKRLEQGTEEERIVVLHALGVAGRQQQFEHQAARFLSEGSEELQFAALDFLATGTGAFRAEDQVWALIGNNMLSSELRCKGLYCLELRHQVDLDRLRRELVWMEPELRYFAARCELAKDPRAAFEILLELTNSDSQPTVTATRRLLAWLTGLSPGSERADFASRLQGLTLAARELPEPTLEFPRN